MAVDMRDVRVGGSTVRGVPAKSIVSPADLADTAAILTEAAARGDAISFLGGGTELGLGYPPERIDTLVKTSRLSRVVEYAPSDMVIEVEAGMTLAALQKHVAPRGQRLALDAPHPELATIGGLVATNGFGPLRTRFGTLRDLIVGVSFLRADGVRVRGGGKVVKNVAGFDLPKIAVGSLGSLGMIATATFRLHPLPETVRALVVAGCDGATLRMLTSRIVARQLEPTAFVASLDERREAYDAYVVFEGFAAGVADQVARFETLAWESGVAAQRIEDAARPGTLDEEARTHGDVRLRLAAPQADLEALERAALAPLARAIADARVVAYPSVGVAFLSGYAADVAGVAAAIVEARRVVEVLGGNLVVLDVRDRTLADNVDPYGTLPSSFFLMQRLKERFDPERRFNPGRFLGGL